MEKEQIFFRYEIVVSALGKLINIMSEDNINLIAGNIEKVHASIVEKEDLTNFLIRQKALINKYNKKLNLLTEEQKINLNKLAETLKRVAAQNKMEISKNIYSNKRVLSMITQIITKESKGVCYNRKGIDRDNSKFRNTPHVAIDQKL